jgi:putative membrane protein
MAIHDFFSETARRRVTEAIARAEKHTSAEIVVALRKASARYRAADLFFASLSAMVTLIIMLFIPAEFPLWSFAFDVAVVFAAALGVARLIPGLGRAFTPREEQLEAVHAAAAAAFLARGVHRCKARNGVLVYVSVLEQAVEIVGDLAIDAKLLEAPRGAARAALLAGNLDAFVTAVEQFGSALATAHPCGADDVNELADEMA